MMLKHCIGCSGPRLGNGQQKSIQMRKFVFFLCWAKWGKGADDFRHLHEYIAEPVSILIWYWDAQQYKDDPAGQLTNTWARVLDLAFLVHLPLLGPEKQPYEDTY